MNGEPFIPAEVRLDDAGEVSRMTLIENEVVVTITLSHVGTRVSVKTLELHIQSLYDLMGISVPSSLDSVFSPLLFWKVV